MVMLTTAFHFSETRIKFLKLCKDATLDDDNNIQGGQEEGGDKDGHFDYE